MESSNITKTSSMTTEKHCERKVAATPYDWPHGGCFSKYDTAIVVVDMQRDFCEAGGYSTNQGLDHRPCRAIIDGVLKVLTLCKQNDFPIYFTRESHRADLSTLPSRELFRSRNNLTRSGIGDQGESLGRSLVRGEPGCAIIPELKAFTEPHDVNVIDKPGRSAFAHTELELMFRNKGIKNLILCGVTTDVCVHSTMREANDRGYDCLLIADACAAGTHELHQFAIDSIQSEGGIFGTVAVIRELLEALSQRCEEQG